MPIIKSILSSDLYKFTMGQAVNHKFPNAWAGYVFINRGGTKFSEEEYREIVHEINNMQFLSLLPNESLWFSKTCPYLNPVYLDWLKSYRYNLQEVDVSFDNGDIKIRIEGPWYRTIYWEVPLMAIISEVYNRNNKQPIENDVYNAHDKICTLSNNGCKVADFGTRRRFSQQHHFNIVKRCAEVPGFVGTSNVDLARKFNIKPIGTQAHEWFMFHGAVYGYCQANVTALKNWIDTYQGQLGIALTDTYTSDNFFKVFTHYYAHLFDGIRQDSGDPCEFAEKAIKHYKQIGIDPQTKTIVFSDGLNVDKVLELNKKFANRIRCSYGIGTNLTNDIYNGAKPLNMVIKMTRCKIRKKDNWISAVKLSDTKGKHTGNPISIKGCKRVLGIE